MEIFVKLSSLGVCSHKAIARRDSAHKRQKKLQSRAPTAGRQKLKHQTENNFVVFPSSNQQRGVTSD